MWLSQCLSLNPQKENALEKLEREESGAKDLVRNLRRKVEEAKSSLAQSRSRGKVLEALLQQKKCGNIPGLYGRLVNFRRLLHF